MTYLKKEGRKEGFLKKQCSSLGGTFKKGTFVRVIGITDRGYDIEDEYGNKMYEVGFDIFETCGVN